MGVFSFGTTCGLHHHHYYVRTYWKQEICVNIWILMVESVTLQLHFLTFWKDLYSTNYYTICGDRWGIVSTESFKRVQESDKAQEMPVRLKFLPLLQVWYSPTKLFWSNEIFHLFYLFIWFLSLYFGKSCGIVCYHTVF